MMVADELSLEAVVGAELLVLVFAVEMVIELMRSVKIMQNEKAGVVAAGKVKRIRYPIVIAGIIRGGWIIGHHRRPLGGVIVMNIGRLSVGRFSG